MELNEILNGLNGINDCDDNKREHCGCRRGFGGSFIWILILLFLLFGFGNNNRAAVEPLFVSSRKTRKKFDVCETCLYTPIQDQCCGMPNGYGMNQGLGGFGGYGSMWWFIIIIIIFCGCGSFGSFGRGIGCNDVCVTK